MTNWNRVARARGRADRRAQATGARTERERKDLASSQKQQRNLAVAQALRLIEATDGYLLEPIGVTYQRLGVVVRKKDVAGWHIATVDRAGSDVAPFRSRMWLLADGSFALENIGATEIDKLGSGSEHLLNRYHSEIVEGLNELIARLKKRGPRRSQS
jgi:hypothetical protein